MACRRRAAFLWDVLFPLLAEVQTLANEAPNEEVDQDVMVHHSRNSPKKQWAETRVQFLQGLARLFNTFHHKLCALPEFPRAWQLVLDFVLVRRGRGDRAGVPGCPGLRALTGAPAAMRPPGLGARRPG